MDRMTVEEAAAAGLTTIIEPGVPVRETPSECADRLSRQADQLAAMVEGALGTARGPVRQTLKTVRDHLGGMHVEADMLATALDEGAAYAGVA